MNVQKIALFSTAALLAIATGSANAAVILDAGKIVSGSLTGTGLIVDTTNEDASGEPTGSDWTDVADDGWENVSSTTIGFQTNKPGWEPDGTAAAADGQQFFNGTVTWTFDVADGSIINGVYAVWGNQGNTPGATYSYSEGAANGSVAKNHKVTSDSATNGGLIISWTDGEAVPVVHNADFETLFTTPITVTGGNGFTITAVADGFGWSDAILIDVVPEPGSLALLGLGGLLVASRRRRD